MCVGGGELRFGAARSAGGDPKWSVSSRLAFPGVVIYRLPIKKVVSNRLEFQVAKVRWLPPHSADPNGDFDFWSSHFAECRLIPPTPKERGKPKHGNAWNSEGQKKTAGEHLRKTEEDTRRMTESTRNSAKIKKIEETETIWIMHG